MFRYSASIKTLLAAIRPPSGLLLRAPVLLVVSTLKAFASPRFARDELGRPEPLGEVDLQRFNVNGGSIAIGHPFGATGVRVTVQLLEELEHRQLNLGLITVCAAGGVGFAMVVERE